MSLRVGLVCLLSHFLANTFGCEDISGRWYNQLGSEIQIDHLPNGRLQGKYYTDVSRVGEKLQGHDIVGTLPYDKPGSSFAFSVTWNNGESTTVWTAQCQVCQGREMLETSWLLRSFVDSCIDKWKSTLIGKDIFYRKLSAEQSRQLKDPEESLKKLQISTPSASECNLQGIWYNNVGSEIIINQTKYGIITGEYRTAVEKDKGSAGSTHSLIYGSSSFGNPNSTFSLIVVWRMGKSVTGWVGQCHVCGENKTVVLEMNWLLRSKVDSCNNVWKSTMYSSNSFTRHEQKAGPRKATDTHTPNRNGEDDDGGTASRLILPNLWLTFVLVCSSMETIWFVLLCN